MNIIKNEYHNGKPESWPDQISAFNENMTDSFKEDTGDYFEVSADFASFLYDKKLPHYVIANKPTSHS